MKVHNLFLQHYSGAVDWEVVLSMYLGWNLEEQALLPMLSSVKGFSLIEMQAQ